MIIDTKELRRLAQEATPGPWRIGAMESGRVAIDGVNGSEVTGFIDPEDGHLILAVANPQAILELLDRLEAAEKERDELRAKIAGLVPIGLLHVGDYYGEELQDWEFEADQQACDRLNEAHFQREASLKLYALPGAHPTPSEETRLVSYCPDGNTCTLNINGVEMYYDRVDRDASSAPSVPDVPAKSLKPVIDWLRNGCDPMKAADELEILIAAAPEAKR